MEEMKINLTVVFEEDQIQDLFEDYGVKFSKAKMKKLKNLLEEMLGENPDLLEEFLMEQMGEIIQDEWEK